MNKPSEKAMVLAQRYTNAVSHLNGEEKKELAIAWAKEIDANTAEATSQQDKVIEECRSTLKITLAYLDDHLVDDVVKCIASIEQLKA